MQTVTDDKGRVITFKEMGPAEMLDLLELAGEQSTNPGWLRMAMVVASVTDIAGTPVPAPKTKDHVRNMARQLGNEGLVALNKAMFDGPGDLVDTAKN